MFTQTRDANFNKPLTYMNIEDILPGDNDDILIGKDPQFEKAKKNFQEKMKDGIIKTFRGRESIKANQEDFKSKVLQIKDFQKQANSILKYDENALQDQEPEKEFSPMFKYTKLFLMLAIAAMAVMYILVANFKKIGTEKSQQVSIRKLNEISYDVSNNNSGIQGLFPVHLFTAFNKNEVLDRMGCLINQDQDLCNQFEERKCQDYDMKTKPYDLCMLRVYQESNRTLFRFCQAHYSDDNQIWTDTDKSNAKFIEDKHECLLNAGKSRGKDYCDEINNFKKQSKDDLYRCYAENKVNKREYADEKCNFQRPKTSYNVTVREDYLACMTKMDNNVTGFEECKVKKFWQNDGTKIERCKVLFDAQSEWDEPTQEAIGLFVKFLLDEDTNSRSDDAIDTLKEKIGETEPDDI